MHRRCTWAGLVSLMLALTYSAVSGPATSLNNTASADLLNVWAGASRQTIDAGSTRGTNATPLPPAGWEVTVGTSSDWKFFVFTNTEPYTNLVFMVLARQPATGHVVHDLDLYVSTNPAFLSLEPTAISQAFNSTARGGEGSVFLPEASLETYYIGVKRESQAAAEFSLLVVGSVDPFCQIDPEGRFALRAFPNELLIPDGGAGTAELLAYCPETLLAHRIVVSNLVTHERFADLRGALRHDGVSVVLNDGTSPDSGPGAPFIWDDSGAGDIPGTQPTFMAGALREFAGRTMNGVWAVSQADLVEGVAGTNASAAILIEPMADLAGGAAVTLLPGASSHHIVSVPIGVTNLQASVSLVFDAGPITVRLHREGDFTNGARATLVGPYADAIVNLDKYSDPPVRSGRYVVVLGNEGIESTVVSLRVGWFGTGEDALPEVFSAAGPVPVTTNLTFSSLNVTNTGRVAAVNVGLRLIHPHVSDLVLSLISPSGTHVLLSENRGADSDAGFGVETILTNVYPVSSTGGAEASTNVIAVGQFAGTIWLQYTNYSLPDNIKVYRGSSLIFESGMVEGTGIFTLSYGPSAAGTVTIVMNEGDNYDPNTAWDYIVTSTSPGSIFAIFTEDQTVPGVPIKFAKPPYVNWTVVPPGLGRTNAVCFRPEQSLDRLVGETASGTWKLRISNTGTNAHEPSSLVMWELYLVTEGEAPLPFPLAHDVERSSEVQPGQTRQFLVSVPGWAKRATNALAGIEGLNAFYSEVRPPLGNGEDLLIAGGVSQTNVVFYESGMPELVPGTDYYIGIQNTNTATANIFVTVNFDVERLTNRTAQEVTLKPGVLPRYFSFDVSTNAASALITLSGLTGDLDLVVGKGVPLPTREAHGFGSFEPDATDEVIQIIADSGNALVAPGKWHLALYSSDSTAVSGRLLFQEFRLRFRFRRFLETRPEFIFDGLVRLGIGSRCIGRHLWALRIGKLFRG